MRLLAALLVAGALSAAELPRIHYSKSFPGSSPAYVAIWIDKSGSGEYSDSPGEQQPLRLQLEPSEAASIFSLAEKLGYFSRPLESGLKVAFTGAKTFRYEDGVSNREVTFNYSQDPNAQLLDGWFQKIAETAGHVIALEQAAKFDRLGVDRALLLLQASYEHGRLAGVRQLLPVLDRIANNQAYFNRARERAGRIAEAIRGRAAKTE